jgi:hypothetical protein
MAEKPIVNKINFYQYLIFHLLGLWLSIGTIISLR